MKTKLFFFSGTGNSLKMARDLAAELGDAEVVPIPEALKKLGSIDADRIGIVFPVYMWGLPLIVAEFCRRLLAPSSAYIFGVATCGSWTLGTTVGTNTLTATRTGVTGSPVTFTATGVAGAATKYVVAANSYTPVAGTAVTLTAQLADQYNNPVATSGIAGNQRAAIMYWAIRELFDETKHPANLTMLCTGGQGGRGKEAGSWDPTKPTEDQWGRYAGRLYVTCLSIYMMEVYYRHMPIYSHVYSDGKSP